MTNNRSGEMYWSHFIQVKNDVPYVIMGKALKTKVNE